MMTTMYLIKVQRATRGKDVFTVEEPRVNYVETHKVKRTGHIPGLGSYNEVEHKGWDKTRLSIRIPRYTDSNTKTGLSGDGRHTGSGWGAVVPNTAAGLKSALRRLRPQEEERIAAVDAEIAEHEQVIKALRVQRRDLVQEAWTKGNVVRLNEIEPGFKH